MRLFIAEKPSLAAEIAKGLGNPQKKTGYFEIDDTIVTWAYGHILQQVVPAAYDERYKYWQMEDLPIIPQHWKLSVSDNCKDQFKVIKDLIDKADEIVNAGDPDREGQLLIDEILDFVGNIKPVKRILLNALDEKSVKAALNDLQDNKKFVGLKNSALARSRADWLIGINLSRAYTLRARNAGYEKALSIGRVKTPTMALVVRRERLIKKFIPVTHYQIETDWVYENQTIKTIWQPDESKVNLDEEGRLLDKSVASNLIQKIKTVAGYSNAFLSNKEEKEKKEAQRLPYSLSALQIDAGRKFGYDPQTVLDTMQQLYEKKLTTYPRSDCDFLPENQLVDADLILNNIATIGLFFEKAVLGADLSIRSKAWNDKKISAHHAIIPTSVQCNFSSLTEIQQKLYGLVAMAFISQFYPVHIYKANKLFIRCSDEIFTCSGKTIIENGWKFLYQKEKNESEEEKEVALPAIEQGEIVKYSNARILEKVTTPPKRFTTSTLLEAMKKIYKFVKDTELQSGLKSIAGIGTEATRAGIIDELQKKGLLALEKKNLIPTNISEMMIDILPDELTYPDTTAIWEDQLEKIVNHDIQLDEFSGRQEAIVRELVKTAQTIAIAEASDIIKCPICGHPLVKRKGSKGVFWACSAYPKCKAVFPNEKNKPVIHKCPNCENGFLRKLKGVKGMFWSCNGYPECKTTFPDLKGKPKLK